MKGYERYVVAHLLRSFVFVLFLLAALFSITSLLDEISEIGTGRYLWPDALRFVLESIPRRLVELVPLTAFLGGILALGRLAATNELTALRAMGITPWQLAWTAGKAGAVLIIGAFFVAQFVAPAIQKNADTNRALAIHDSSALQVKGRFWFRDGERFVEVGRLLPGGRLGEVVIYGLDGERRMVERIRAQEAHLAGSEEWVLQDVWRDDLTGDWVESTHIESMPWQTSFERSFMDLTALRPESLSISELLAYVGEMRTWGQTDETYALHLWRVLGLPLSGLGMLLLAIPFSLAIGRSSSKKRLLLGGGLGGLGYALDRVGCYVGMLSGANAALVALLPGTLILIGAIGFMRRAR